MTIETKFEPRSYAWVLYGNKVQEVYITRIKIEIFENSFGVIEEIHWYEIKGSVVDKTTDKKRSCFSGIELFATKQELIDNLSSLVQRR